MYADVRVDHLMTLSMTEFQRCYLNNSNRPFADIVYVLYVGRVTYGVSERTSHVTVPCEILFQK